MNLTTIELVILEALLNVHIRTIANLLKIDQHNAEALRRDLIEAERLREKIHEESVSKMEAA